MIKMQIAMAGFTIYLWKFKEMNARGKYYSYIGLFVVLVLPVLSVIFRPANYSLTNSHLLIGECIIWVLFLLVVVLAKYGEQQPLAFSGNGTSLLKSMVQSVIIIICMLLAGVVFSLFYRFVLKTQPPHETYFDKLLKLPFWLKLMLVIRAGVVEETFFRAYAISRIKQLTNNNFLAFSIPLIVFAACHYTNGGLNHVAGTFIIGIVLSVAYLKTKNLLANMMAHTLFDALFLLPF